MADARHHFADPGADRRAHRHRLARRCGDSGRPRRRARTRTKADCLAGDRRRRSLRGRHPRGPGAAPARRAGGVGGSRRAGRSSPATRFVLVDPLDGTRELVAGRDEFCVNLAVVSRRPAAARPHRVAGARAGLAHDRGGGAERLRLAPGAPAGAATERTAIRTRPWPADRRRRGRQPLASRSADARRSWRGCRRPSGSPAARRSSSAGWPRARPTSIRGSRRCSEWDVAAGDAIVTAAGGLRHHARTARRSPMAARRRLSGRRASWPGATRRRRPGCWRLIRATSVQLDRWPVSLGRLDDAVGIVAEGVARLRAYRRDRAARRRSARAAGRPATPTPRATADRVIAAEARHIDVGIGREGGAVALVAEAPDRPRKGIFEVARPRIGRRHR